MDRKQVIIFAGTTEGRTISEYLASCKVPVTACVATEYGETLLTENEYLKVHAWIRKRSQHLSVKKGQSL